MCSVPWTEKECWGWFEEYEIIAEGNTAIAVANTTALKKSYGAYDSLIGAGKSQQDYAELREEQLRIERREHTMDNWFYRGIIVIGGLVLIGTN